MPNKIPGQKSVDYSPTGDAQCSHLLFEQSPVPMFVYETNDLRLLTANEAFISKYGYCAEDITDLHLTDLHPEQEKRTVVEVAKTFGEGEDIRAWRHRAKDGSEISVSAHSRPIVYEGYPARLVVVTAIPKHEERLRQVESIAHLGSLDWDLDSNTIALSEEARRLYGIRLDEPLVSPEQVERITHPGDVAFVRAALDLAIRGERPYDVDHRLLLPDGTVKWVHSQGRLEKDREGKGKRLVGTVLDITGRQEAMSGLHEREERYQKLIDLLPDALFVNVNGRIVLANPACCKLLGAKEPSELIGKAISEIIHPDFSDSIKERQRATLAGGSVPLREEKCFRLDGSVVDVDATGVGIEWRGSRGSQVIIRDITARKQAERELRQSQERYRRLFEDHSAAKLVVDIETNAILAANEAASRFYGWSREELTTMTLKDINVLQSEQLRALIARTVSKGENRLELRHRHADGSTREVEIFASVIELEEKKVLEAIIHDISDRKRAEAALQESEKRYRHLIMFLSDPISIQVDGRMAFANEAMCRLLGADNPAQLQGQPVLEFIHPDFHELVYQRQSLLAEGQPLPAVDEKFVRFDGTVVDVEVSGVAVEWEGVLGVQIMARDVTARKAAEVEIRRLNRIYGVLSAIDKAIVRIHDAQQLFAETCRIAVEDGGFLMGWLGVVVPEAHKVIVLSSFGDVGDYLESIDLDLEDARTRKGPTGRAVLSGTHVISNDIEHDEKMRPWRENAARMGYRSSAAFPIVVSDKVWGVFNLYSAEMGFFNSDEITLLDELALDISFAIQVMYKETDRKRAEESLVRSEELLRTSLRVANIGVYEHDHLNKTAYFSPRQREIHGIGQDTPVEFEEFLRHVHRDDFERVSSKIRESYDPAGDGLLNSQYRIVRPDGSIGWLLAFAETVFEGRGSQRHPVRTVGAVLDITEQKEAEDQLRLSGQIIDRVNSLILIADAKGRISYVSPSVGAILGYEREELLGDGWWRLARRSGTPGRDQTTVGAIARGDLPINESTYEGEVRAKDGTVHWILWQEAKSPNRELIGVGQDITERKQAEEALMLSERKFRDIFESAPLGIYRTTPDGKLTACNQEMARILGYDSPWEMVDLDMANGVHVDREARLSLVESVNARGYVFDEEIPWRKRDGTPVWVQVDARSIKDEEGRTLRFEGFVRDITERKLAEEQLKENEARRRELERWLSQSQKLESLGTLASGIAHDFNNLLGVIMGHTSLLQGHLQDSAPGAHKSIEAILAASTRGASLVKQMLTFARKTDVSTQPVLLNDIVHEVRAFIQETFPKTINVEVDLEEGLPLIDADPTQVHQVLLNLCVNARDAMADGGILTITSRKRDGSSLLDTYPAVTAESYVTLSVRDTGTGMNEETQRRIFEPFFTTKEHGMGTGLGLSLVFGIMQSHNGFVGLRSELNRGTTFDCFFPLPTSTEEIARPEVDGSQSAPSGNETVLVVEDEEPLRELLRQVLTSKGYSVLLAENGEEGFSIYRDRRSEIALVLSDLGLPKFGGDELYRRLKQIDSNVRLIMASGFVQPNMKATMLQEGVKEVIPKPYSLNELLRVVRRVLDERCR